MTPSCAVTTTGMVFTPTARDIAPDAEPDATEIPLTFTVELVSETVGVTVKDVVVFETVDAYAVVDAEKVGVVVRPVVARADRVESDDVASSRIVNQSLLPEETK